MKLQQTICYIQNENNSLSVQNPDRSILSKQENEIKNNHSKMEKVWTEPSISNLMFGLDRITCTIPKFDIQTGEILYDEEFIQSQLKSFSNVNTFANEHLQEITDTFEYFEPFVENDQDIQTEAPFNTTEISSKVLGTHAKLPINIQIKQDILKVDIILPRLKSNHNAIPFPIAELPNAFEVISEALGIDFTQMKLEKVEYTLGIIDNRPIEHIVESLGEATKGKRYPMLHGARWNGIGCHSSIQVYSTNLKNKHDYLKGKGERFKELERLSEAGFDVIRIEMKKTYGQMSNITVNMLLNPSFIYSEIESFKNSFKKIRKEITQLPIQGLEDVDFKDALDEVINSKDLSKILQAVGVMFLHDLALNMIDSKSLKNKSRLFNVLSKSLKNAEEMSMKFKFEEHFHCVVMNALVHFSELYGKMPSSVVKESYSPMELIIKGSLYQN